MKILIEEDVVKQALEALHHHLLPARLQTVQAYDALHATLEAAEKVEPSKYSDIISDGGFDPRDRHPAPAVPEIKPHQIAQLVNELRDIAVKYHDHQSLRERLAGPVHDLWKVNEPRPTFAPGDRVRKTKGSRWQGRIVGWYSTTLTPEGYAVESETETGSVQIYPVSALEKVE